MEHTKNKNEFDPDYDFETIIMGKEDLEAISNALAKIDCLASNVDEARQINSLVLKAQTLICNWFHPKAEA